MIDITPFPFFLEIFLDWIKVRTRPLAIHEQELALSIFGTSIPLRLIGIDPASVPARKKITVAYTTLHTINFDKSISEEIFIHELVHVWQYRTFGSLYISEALWAQRWGGGYNYGGIDALILNEKEGLSAFNFEQQADIVEDYFRLKNNLPLQWSSPEVGIEKILKRYVDGGMSFS